MKYVWLFCTMLLVNTHVIIMSTPRKMKKYMRNHLPKHITDTKKDLSGPSNMQEIAQYIMIDSRFNKRSTGNLICPMCERTFLPKWRANMLRHIKRKHKVNPFFCLKNNCAESFVTNKKLLKHISEKHSSLNLSVEDAPRIIPDSAQMSAFDECIFQVMYGDSPQPLSIQSTLYISQPFDISDAYISSLPTDRELGLKGDTHSALAASLEDVRLAANDMDQHEK